MPLQFSRIGYPRARVVHVFDFFLHALAELIHVARRVVSGRNRFPNHQFQLARTDVKRVHRQDFISPHNRHGDHRHTRFDRDVKRAAQEWANLASLGAAAFGEDHEIHSALHRFSGTRQAAQIGARIFVVDGNLSGAAQMPSHERISEQFFLGENSKRDRQARVDQRDIERGNVIRGEDHRL